MNKKNKQVFLADFRVKNKQLLGQFFLKNKQHLYVKNLATFRADFGQILSNYFRPI